MWEITPEKSARVYERVRFTWTMNAQPVLLKNSTRSRPQGRNGDYTLMWIAGPCGVSRYESAFGLPLQPPQCRRRRVELSAERIDKCGHAPAELVVTQAGKAENVQARPQPAAWSPSARSTSCGSSCSPLFNRTRSDSMICLASSFL